MSMQSPREQDQVQPINTQPIRSNFTLVFDAVVEDLGPTAALVFGVVWRYCQRREHVCRASLRELAQNVGTHQATVLRHVKKLVKLGYLEDLTPGLRHVPHTYRDTGKVEPARSDAERNRTVAGSNTTDAERNRAVAQSNTTDAECNSGDAQSNTSVAQSQLRILDTTEDTGETKDSAQPRARKPSDGPELQLFREAAEFYPPKPIFDDVIAAVQAVGRRLGREPTPDDLRSYFKAWIGRGWNPHNLAWLFDWAVNGAIPESPKPYRTGGTDGNHLFGNNPALARPVPEPISPEERERLIRFYNGLPAA